MAPSDEDGESALSCSSLPSERRSIPEYLNVLSVSPADDSCLLVVILETHENLWSALAEESESPDVGNLSLTTLLQQVCASL